MPNQERGVYQPPDQNRVFDAAEDEEDEGSRAPLLLVIGLLVVAAFAGVVWLAYVHGVQRGREDAPRIIAAQPGPMKEAAGGAASSTPYTGLKVYQQPAPADDEATDEDGPPQPPTTIAPAAKPAAVPGTAPATANAMTAMTTPKPAAMTTPKPAPAKPAPVKPEADERVATAPPATLKPAETTTTDLPPPVAAKPAPAASSGSTYVLQIGAYKSESDASAAWKAYQAKHPLAGGYSSDIVKVDLADKGIWYRLRIGSFADKNAATALCDKLKADGGGCFPAKS